MIRATVFSCLLVLQATVAFAQSCCIDPDVAAAFQPQVSYSRDWPEAFPARIDGADLTYIGSSSRGERSTQVAWKTELEPSSVLERFAESLLAQDWRLVPQHERTQAMFQRGFVPFRAVKIVNHQQFCRDLNGLITLSARPSEVGTIVALGHRASQAGERCSSLIAERKVSPRMGRGLLKYLPTLVLPESARASDGPSSGGGSSDAHASILFVGDASAAELARSFESQLTEQQWTLDTRIQGSESSGHVWRREVDGMTLTCVVTAFDSGDRVRLRMHVEPL